MTGKLFNYEQQYSPGWFSPLVQPGLEDRYIVVLYQYKFKVALFSLIC